MKHLLAVREQLTSGKISLQDISEGYLETIKSRNPEINAFVHVDEDDVRNKAASIQQKIDNGTAGSLAGAVVGVKDVICEKGKKNNLRKPYPSQFRKCLRSHCY